MGQQDIRLTEQLDTLVKNAKVRIRSYLVMSATSQRRVMQEAVDHFRRIPLSGCILTKLDESLNLGEVINVCIQNALPISYITDGQRVPEDIQVANARCWSVPPCQVAGAGSRGSPISGDRVSARPKIRSFMSNMYMDQASGLRKMRQNNRVKVIAVSGGKGASARPT